MHAVLTDMRVAARRFLREPAFTITALLTLAVGIGANSAIFTLVNGVLLRPLPFTAPAELVQAHAILRGESRMVFSAPMLVALREHGTAFTGVALFGTTTVTLTGGDGAPEQLTGAAISGNYFDVVGVEPLRGRLFREEENEPGSTPVVLLGEGTWRVRFAADENIIGRTIELNGRSAEVVGVMPAHASLPSEWRFWVPQPYTTSFRDPENVQALGYGIVARLRPGVTIERASADVARVVELTKEAGGVVNPEFTGAVRPLRELHVRQARAPLLLLLGAVGLVLLIVCANIANLMLAQAASRTTDFAVRRAMGASNGQLMRQVLTESLVLALAGGAAGLLLGAWAGDALVRALPAALPRMPDMGVDLNVALYTFGLSLLAAAVFGLAPALHARRSTIGLSLRAGGRGMTAGGGRTRAGLVIAETALAVALVIGAGLLLRSFSELRNVNPGFTAEGALTFEVDLPAARYDSDVAIAGFWDRLEDRLSGLPGVAAAGGIQHLPLSGSAMVITFDVEGREPPAPGHEPVLDIRLVSPGYFSALGVPLRRGRVFRDTDRAGALPVVLLSEAAVARHFPGEDPIGQRIILGWSRRGEFVQGVVVGVVGDVRHEELRYAAEPEVYFPVAQVPYGRMNFTVRTAGGPLALAPAVTAAVHELDAGLAVAGLRPLNAVVAASMAADRFVTQLISVFGAIALLLAGIGIFGVISYGVAQRRREIGVRMAVGAASSDVLRLIVTDALRLAAAGILIGMVSAALLVRLLDTLLFGVQPLDPVTFAASGLALLAVAAMAGFIPAMHAARMPPAAVLNQE